MIEQGTILDNKYKILQPIGEGGGGEIFLADHLRLEKKVVIKKIKDRVRGVIESRGEADILKRLSHPYLPQVYDYFIENDQVYTVMEYIEGENLQQLLKRGVKFSTKDIIKWGTQLSEVVAYLHSQTPPIIHRDIKPSNIMRTPNGDVYLIDFNVSLEQDKTKGFIAHTDGYAPLEQYGIRKESKKEAAQPVQVEEDDVTELSEEDITETASNIEKNSDNETDIVDNYDMLPEKTDMENMEEEPVNNGTGASSVGTGSGAQKFEVLPQVDERSDVYSLGATLYHIIAHRRPEKATERVTPLSECDINVSEGLVHIIDKSMQQNPSKRYQTAEEMRKAFVNIRKLDGEYRAYARWRDIMTGAAIALACISVVCMVLGYQKIGAERYNAYVKQLNEAHELYMKAEMEEASELCKKAIEMRPQDLTAYIELANIYYMWGYYEEGISVIQQFDTSREVTNEEIRSQWSMIYFLQGECYMGLEEFGSAVTSYKKAIEFKDSEENYYTRCAIALAREGDSKGAEQFLEDALQKGISDADVYLMKAEILLNEKKYKDAEELVNKALDLSVDDDLSYHAYLTGIQVYEQGSTQIDNALEKKQQLLENAAGQLSDAYALSISEQLADVYFELAGTEENETQAKKYYENALTHFNKIYNNGYKNIHVLQNLAIINQTLGKYEDAEKMLLNMIEMYPDEYTGYMYLALLYLEIQNQLSGEEATYNVIVENYDKANVLYQRYLNNGGAVDTQMQILGNMIDDLRFLVD